MLACTEKVTLVRHIADRDSDKYDCTVLDSASWFSKTVIVTSADGAAPANTYEVRVMGAPDIQPRPGDYIVRGEISGVTKPADLKGREHFRLTSVGDNRRGRLAHWRFSGS